MKVLHGSQAENYLNDVDRGLRGISNNIAGITDDFLAFRCFNGCIDFKECQSETEALRFIMGLYR